VMVSSIRSYPFISLVASPPVLCIVDEDAMGEFQRNSESYCWL
jgi:hypothetical protein